MTGYKCPLTKPVTSLRIKTDKVTADLVYTHFTDCQIHIDGVNLVEYAQKLRRNATTIEMWDADTLVGLCACYVNDYETRTAYITHIAVSPSIPRLRIRQTPVGNNHCCRRRKRFPAT